MASIHALRVDEVFTALESSRQGLTLAEAQARLAQAGRNELTRQAPPAWWQRLGPHFRQPLAVLLWISAVLALLIGSVFLSGFIVVIALANGLFSVWQEYRAEQAMSKLEQLLPAQTRVQRGGVEQLVPAAEVVVGDVLVLAEGDHIAADARVIEEYGLRLNTAALNGEARAVRKTAEASVRGGLTEVERPNLVFAGTTVAAGTGRAVVFATGMTTQFGRIARLTQAVAETPSPLQRELKHLADRVLYVALGLGAVVFSVSLVQFRMDWPHAFLLALGLIVAVVPEGLIPTITVALAIAARRLAQQGILIKKLTTVETLGLTSVLCTDKSGTLTQNQMTVRELWVGGHCLTVSGVGYEPRGEFTPPPSADVGALLLAALLCNNARLTPPSPGQPRWSALGDQTEAALRVVALKGGVDEQRVNQDFPRAHELPFDARRKRMSTIHQPAQHPALCVTKGAPREVVQLCDTYWLHGEARPLDDTTRAAVLKANDDFARAGLRVLALAQRALPPRTGAYRMEEVEHELTLLGLLAMMDPPRPEVEQTVAVCRQAGIRLVMITGDYGLTAEAIARRLGMLTAQTVPRLITGAEVDEMDEATLQAALSDEVIFARMAPEHKLRVVTAFQARGEVVAVTGDGVNDAPALRKADIGIAMGITGTDVAKEAADVILARDDFASLIPAIQQGRAVYANLRKFLIYLFASNLPEVVPFIISSLFNFPLALTVGHLLAIDFGTDLLPALALSAEAPEPEIMSRPPRPRAQNLLDRKIFERAAWLGAIETGLCYSGFLLVFWRAQLSPFAALGLDLQAFATWGDSEIGVTYALAVTVFFAGVIVAQMGAAVTCRSELGKVRRLGVFSNRWLLAGLACELGVLSGLVFGLPLLGPLHIFSLTSPEVFLTWVLCYAPIVYLLDRARKSLKWRRGEAR